MQGARGRKSRTDIGEVARELECVHDCTPYGCVAFDAKVEHPAVGLWAEQTEGFLVRRVGFEA